MQDPDLQQAEWAVRFVAALRLLGSRADPALLADRGCELWESNNVRSPEDAARAELAVATRSPAVLHRLAVKGAAK